MSTKCVSALVFSDYQLNAGLLTINTQLSHSQSSVPKPIRQSQGSHSETMPSMANKNSTQWYLDDYQKPANLDTACILEQNHEVSHCLGGSAPSWISQKTNTLDILGPDQKEQRDSISRQSNPSSRNELPAGQDSVAHNECTTYHALNRPWNNDGPSFPAEAGRVGASNLYASACALLRPNLWRWESQGMIKEPWTITGEVPEEGYGQNRFFDLTTPSECNATDGHENCVH